MFVPGPRAAERGPGRLLWVGVQPAAAAGVRERRRQRAAASGAQRTFVWWQEAAGVCAMARGRGRLGGSDGAVGGERGTRAHVWCARARLVRACSLAEGMCVRAVANRRQVWVRRRGCARVHAPLTGVTRVQVPRTAIPVAPRVRNPEYRDRSLGTQREWEQKCSVAAARRLAATRSERPATNQQA